jgi:uncharacterized protein YecE (DUF72 family)
MAAIMFRVPDPMQVAPDRLGAMLAAWPRELPLTVEFQHESWHVDEIFAALREAGAALCATELPEDEVPPTLRLTGPFLYLRLRRHDYTPAELAAWAARLEPFLASGADAFVFFRHDETGRAPELAAALDEAVRRSA